MAFLVEGVYIMRQKLLLHYLELMQYNYQIKVTIDSIT